MASSRTETAMAVDGWGLAGVFCCFPSPAHEPSKRQNARRAPVSARPRAIRSPFERSVPPLSKRTAPTPIDAGRRVQVLARPIEGVGEAGDRLSLREPGWRNLARRGRLKPCRSFGTMWVRIPPRALFSAQDPSLQDPHGAVRLSLAGL